MKKPKILIVSTFYFPLVGGAEVAVKETFIRLKEFYDIEILTGKMNRKFPAHEVMDGIKVHRVGFGNMKIDKVFFPICGFLYAMFKKYDIMYAVLCNQSALVARMTQFFRRKPVILNEQSGDTEKYLKDKLGMLYFLYNLTFSKKFEYHVISKYLEQRCILHGIKKDRIRIIPNGVDLERFKPTLSANEKIQLRQKYGFSADDFIVVTTSRLAFKNAVGDVIKAFKYLKDKKIKFLVCGVGELEKECKDLVKQLKLEKQIIFVGSIEHKLLPKILEMSDIFIRPSISEGFGNSFVEAMGCKIPIIATYVGGIKDFLVDRKTGLVVKVKNQQDIAKKIMLYKKDEDLKNKIIENGYNMVHEKYSWNYIAEELKDYIDEIYQKKYNKIK